MKGTIGVDDATWFGIAEAIADIEPLAELVDQALDRARGHLAAWELAVIRDWPGDYDEIPSVGCAALAARLSDLLWRVSRATDTSRPGWLGEEFDASRRRALRRLRAVESLTD
jgi:hypothetical protein